MYQQQETFQESVVITKPIESRLVGVFQVFTIHTDKGRFQFWSSKKDGSDTKAYSQLKQFGFKQGDPIQIAYTVTESGMNERTGQPFQNKNISYFVTQDKNTPATHNPPVQHTYQANFNGAVQSVPPVQRWGAPVATQTNHENIPVITPAIPQVPQQSDAQRLNQTVMDLTLRVQALEDSLKKTIQVVSGHGTLLTSMSNQTAVDLHTSFPVKGQVSEVSQPGEYIEEGLCVQDVADHFNPNN
jgi:hypothetical protein